MALCLSLMSLAVADLGERVKDLHLEFIFVFLLTDNFWSKNFANGKRKDINVQLPVINQWTFYVYKLYTTTVIFIFIIYIYISQKCSH